MTLEAKTCQSLQEMEETIIWQLPSNDARIVERHQER